MAAEQFLNRFSDFHKELDELKKIADDTWYQGGMVWTVELLKRGASTVDLVGYQNVFSEHRNISILTWAELIWSIKGQHGNFDNALDNEQWQAEESRNIDLHMQDARKLLEYFRPVGRREKYFMRTDRCPASLAVTTMFVSNRPLFFGLWIKRPPIYGAHSSDLKSETGHKENNPSRLGMSVPHRLRY